jgi:tRNA/tmRNA/rRNA uracil-C5-methylase (TrmA/RlmC/RlmD family)
VNSGSPITLTAGRLIGGGVCLAHHDGATWVVRGALPDETVQVNVTGRRAGVVEAEAVAVVDGGHPLRMADPCPHAPRCGGCDWPFLRGEDGASLKPEMAAEAIRSVPALAAAIRSAPITASADRARLRARLHWDPATRSLGFRARRSHDVEPIPECRVISPAAAAARGALERSLAERCPEPAEVEWLEDLTGLRAVVGLRTARRDSGPPPPDWIPNRDDLPSTIVGAHALSRRGARPGGWGVRELIMDLPIPLVVPLGAFFQGNRHLVPTLFARFGALVGGDDAPIWDLHAGVGFLAAAARHGVPRPLVLSESSPVAAAAARRNLPDATVHVGATAERTLGSHRLPAEATVLLDPPRSGLSRRLGNQLLERRPRCIVMMSCNVATWARDTKRLQEGGYEISHLELFDLFPMTHHVEVLSVLVR